MIAFTTGVLLAAAFLTGIGGGFMAGVLLFTFASALLILTARSVRWMVRHNSARSQARVDDFGRYSAPPSALTDATVLPA